jgi:hypothetical protein
MDYPQDILSGLARRLKEVARRKLLPHTDNVQQVVPDPSPLMHGYLHASSLPLVIRAAEPRIWAE